MNNPVNYFQKPFNTNACNTSKQRFSDFARQAVSIGLTAIRIMKTATELVFLISFCALTGNGGTIDDVSTSVVFLRDTKPITEQANGISYEVCLRDPRDGSIQVKTRTVSGTGFVVICSNLCFLVTAKHVASEMTTNCEVIMGGTNTEPEHFTLSSLTGQANQLMWVDDPTADISVYPLPTITPEGIEALNQRAAPLGFLSPETNPPSRDIPVTALGFPLGLGAQEHFIPLSRESKVSSGILRDAQGFFFLLQDPIVSGYSGGPLITSGDPRLVYTPSGPATASGGARCVGFIIGTYADETGGKMTRIVPAFYALRLINKTRAQMNITLTH